MCETYDPFKSDVYSLGVILLEMLVSVEDIKKLSEAKLLANP